MATLKDYAYYIKGNKVAIVEKDFTPIQDGQTLTAPSIDLPTGGGIWKSPLSTADLGLEIEYVYSPQYFINETSDRNTAIDAYTSVNGYLNLHDTGNDDFSASPESLTDGSYIVLSQAGRFNGLHKVSSASAGRIITYTLYSGSDIQADFERTVIMHYNVNVLNDETDTIDLPTYLTKALVYYIKAKHFEDLANLEMKEYFMKQFRTMVEKHESGKIWGSRRIMSGNSAIR